MNKFINKSLIIKDEIYLKNQKFLLCKICEDILIEPMKCSKCISIFCKKCVDDWMAKNKKCPNNCEQSNYNESAFINDIICQISFKCLFCNENIKYNEIKDHYLDNHNDKISSNIFHNFNTPEIIKMEKKLEGKKKRDELFSIKCKK